MENVTMSKDVGWIVAIAAILFTPVAANNLLIGNDDTTHLGYMNVSAKCRGARSSDDTCLGAERLVFEGQDVKSGTEKALVETEMAVRAGYHCDKFELSGYQWKEFAKYKDKSFGEWKQKYPELRDVKCGEVLPYPFVNSSE